MLKSLKSKIKSPYWRGSFQKSIIPVLVRKFVFVFATSKLKTIILN